MCDAFVSPLSQLIYRKLQVSSFSNDFASLIKLSIRSKYPSVHASVNQNHSNRWSLQGMTALVTGGTRGIGHATVEELAGHGAIVHICARNESELNSCLKEWVDEGFEITGSVCLQHDREKLINEISYLFGGKLNILPMVDLTAKEFTTMMSTNFESVFHICQLAYPLLKASKAGSVVFTSSVSGFVSLKSMTVQGATKGLVNWAGNECRMKPGGDTWNIKKSVE